MDYRILDLKFSKFKISQQSFSEKNCTLEQKANKNVLNTEKSFNKLKIHIIATRHEYGAIPC